MTALEPNLNGLPAPTREVGVTGLKSRDGHVTEEWQRELQGDKALRMWREMGDSPIGGAVLAVMLERMRGSWWRAEPADPSPAALFWRDFVAGAMHDMSHSWDAGMDERYTMLQYGWEYSEVVYKRRVGTVRDPATGRWMPGESSKFADGLWGWRKMPTRAQDTRDRWVLDESGGVRGMIQKVTPDNWIGKTDLRALPIEKCLLFRTTAHRGNPEGRSVFRSGWTAYTAWKELAETMLVVAQRGLPGIPVGKVPPEVVEGGDGAAGTANTEWNTILRQIRNDEQAYVLMPLDYDANGHPRYDLDFLSGVSSVDYIAGLTYWGQMMAMSVLADVMMLGHQKVGTEALARTKLEMLVASMNGLHDSIAATFNDHAIPRLMILNDAPLELAPRLVPSAIEDIDLEAFADGLNSIANLGVPVVENKAFVRWMLSQFGAPAEALDEQDEIDPPPRELQPNLRRQFPSGGPPDDGR